MLQLNKNQEDAIKRLIQSGEVELFKSFLNDLARHYSDLRNIPKGLSPEQYAVEGQARQLCATIIENEIIARLSRLKENKEEESINEDDYQ